MTPDLKPEIKACPACVGDATPWSFGKFCDKHNVCVVCGISRKDITEAPWGVRIGAFKCRACELSERKKRIAARQAKEIDHEYTDEVTCPHCGYEFSDSWEMREGDDDCPECEKTFEIEINTSITYTTRKGAEE